MCALKQRFRQFIRFKWLKSAQSSSAQGTELPGCWFLALPRLNWQCKSKNVPCPLLTTTVAVYPGECCAHAVACMGSCAGFLGDVHATSAEPLHPRDIFRKHPQHGVLYQNWNLSALKDGDVLVVRNNDSFFAAILGDTGQRHPLPAPPDTSFRVEDGAQHQNISFQSRAMKFFRDPNSSRCAVHSFCPCTHHQHYHPLNVAVQPCNVFHGSTGGQRRGQLSFLPLYSAALLRSCWSHCRVAIMMAGVGSANICQPSTTS